MTLKDPSKGDPIHGPLFPKGCPSAITPAQADVAIGGKLRVSVPLEFLWTIRERMQAIRAALDWDNQFEAMVQTRKVEMEINALVKEASNDRST